MSAAMDIVNEMMDELGDVTNLDNHIRAALSAGVRMYHQTLFM